MMNGLKILLFLLILLSHKSYAESIVETYPSLQKYVYSEKQSNTYLGFGISPLSILNNRLGFSANLFQVHWIKNLYDFEIFSTTFGTTFGQNQAANNQYFVFRSVPKIKIFGAVSIGPVIGLEFVSFSNLPAQLGKNNEYTQQQPFSSLGFIYGGAISENFQISQNFILKLNEIVYKENYSYLGTNNGWQYLFNQQVKFNTSPIQPSTVFVLEISILY